MIRYIKADLMVKCPREGQYVHKGHCHTCMHRGKPDPLGVFCGYEEQKEE